jgi:hypothetical protein
MAAFYPEAARFDDACHPEPMRSRTCHPEPARSGTCHPEPARSAREGSRRLEAPEIPRFRLGMTGHLARWLECRGDASQRASLIRHLEPAHSRTCHPDPARSGTCQPEPARSGTCHPDPARSGTCHPEPARSGTCHPEPARSAGEGSRPHEALEIPRLRLGMTKARRLGMRGMVIPTPALSRGRDLGVASGGDSSPAARNDDRENGSE